MHDAKNQINRNVLFNIYSLCVCKHLNSSFYFVLNHTFKALWKHAIYKVLLSFLQHWVYTSASRQSIMMYNKSFKICPVIHFEIYEIRSQHLLRAKMDFRYYMGFLWCRSWTVPVLKHTWLSDIWLWAFLVNVNPENSFGPLVWFRMVWVSYLKG